MLDSIPVNNPNVSFLQYVLFQKFETEKWESLKKDTSFFKLDWKAKITNEDENTFYKMLVYKEFS